MRINSILFILLVSFPYISLAEMYKQVDIDGNTTYSNIPSQNAKEVDLPPLIVIPAPTPNNADKRIKERIQKTKILEQREAIEKKISEETNRLNAIKSEYKGGVPDRLGSERNYQRYLDRVERLESEITFSEENLKILKQELKRFPDPNK